MVHWRHLANTTELMLTSATPVHNPNGKSTGLAVFAQLTTKCRRAHWRHLANITKLCFLRPTPVHNTTQTANRSVQPFCTAHGRKSL